MVYTTYKNGDLGDCLLLFYPHYSVFHRHGSLQLQNYEHPDVEGIGVPRSGARGVFFARLSLPVSLNTKLKNSKAFWVQ